MQEADLELIRSAVEDAGEIALKYHRKDPETWEKGDGQGPVTEADLEIDAFLRDRLISARPGYGWLSEESEDNQDRLDEQKVFIVDPIDGTRAFIDGGASFSHVIAIAEKGEIVAAAVHLPVLERTYAAAIGQGTQLNGQKVHVSDRQELEGADVLTAQANMRAEHWTTAPPPVSASFRSSLAYRMCLVAEGRFDAMLTFRDAWEWDVAAGTLIVREAEGIVTGSRGEALAYNNRLPKVPGIIAGGAAVHGALLARRSGTG